MSRRSLDLALVALLVLGADASAPPDSAPAAEPAKPTPTALDRLLRVPSVDAPQSELHGGRSRRTWVESFSKAEAEVAELEQRISETQAALRARTAGDWAYTPQGASAPSDPDVLKLRADLRRDRQSLEAARTRLRDLEVEASLAGVPEGWRRPEE